MFSPFPVRITRVLKTGHEQGFCVPFWTRDTNKSNLDLNVISTLVAHHVVTTNEKTRCGFKACRKNVFSWTFVLFNKNNELTLYATFKMLFDVDFFPHIVIYIGV